MAYLRSQTTLAPESSGLSECLDRLAARKNELRPLSTYRLQFHRGFRFQDALALVDYLHDLGVSHVYSSPILQARAGSTHGYDIIDHNKLNPELGAEEDFQALTSALQARGIGIVLDVVPNHMGVGHGTNPWWQDVLESGRASAYADFFDIDWHPFKSELRNKVLLPILGDQYGEELESGKLRLDYREGRFFVKYYDKRLPIDPQTVPLIFETLGDFRTHWPQAGPRAELGAFENLLVELRSLAPNSTSDPAAAKQRQEALPQLRQRLASLIDSSAPARQLVDEAVRLCNGEPGNARSFDPLHRLLEAQAYRPAHWRVSAEEINYRRFFDINDLVGLRMENPRVFAETHRLLRRLLAEGSVSGLRVDHPDGLLNPLQYFTRLQMLYAASQCSGAEPVPPLADNGIEAEMQEIFGQHDWMNRRAPLFVAVEKILEPGEELPLEWPADGTSGYDFVRLVNGIFIERRNERAFTNLYRRFIGVHTDVDGLIYRSKKLIMHAALSSEVTVLAHMLDEISLSDRRARDFTRKSLTDAIRETIACFPVYRTYVDERGNVSERDRAYIHEAVARAKRRNPGAPPAVFDFLRDILLLKDGTTNQWSDGHRRRLQFTLKFQQLTGPVMAKGLEDTACYVYNRFLSVNEVGSTPREFGVSVDEFHGANLKRAEHWPSSMLATSTHDTKRSEEVRARLNVLSEMPKQWSAAVMRWRRMNRARKRTIADGRTVPDFNEEYLLYQTLVGCWPLVMASSEERRQFTGRIQEYMTKAAHEAKVNLSWVNPNPEYIEALRGFIERILLPGTPHRPNHFAADLEEFLPPVAYFGAMNSIAQVVLKMASAGVPDTYQGAEIWDFSLVDPDNRRPVDHRLRRDMLGALLEEQRADGPLEVAQRCLRDYRDGRLKLWVTTRALRLRRDHASLFRQGAYLPLYGSGPQQEHVVAFARTHGTEIAVAAVPRFSWTLMRGAPGPPLGPAWGDTQLLLPRAGEFENVFTGEVVRSNGSRAVLCRELFGSFPVALLLGR